MEKDIRSLRNKNEENAIDVKEMKIKENYNINDFSFSFENKKEIDTNFLSNIILEKDTENKNNDYEEEEEDNKEENSVLQSILDDLNKNVEINVKDLGNENENYKECQEILDILKYPRSHKNVRENISPFKPLLKPKKVSLIGKVFYDFPDENNNNNINNNTTENTTYNDKII